MLGTATASRAASSASEGATTRRARKYAGTADSDMSTALIAFAAAYACGTEPKSRYAGLISTGYTNPYETLGAALELLTGATAARATMSAAAREYVRREHDLDRVADAYVAALEEAAGGEAVRDAVVGEVAEAAAEVGVDAEGEEAAEIARLLNEVRLGG